MDVNGTALRYAGVAVAVVAAVVGAAEAMEGRTIGENAVMNGAEIATSETVMRKISLVVVEGVDAGAVGDAAMEGMAIGSMAEVLVGMVVLVHRDPRGRRDLQGRQVLWAMVVDRLRRIHSHLLLPHQ